MANSDFYLPRRMRREKNCQCRPGRSLRRVGVPPPSKVAPHTTYHHYPCRAENKMTRKGPRYRGSSDSSERDLRREYLQSPKLGRQRRGPPDLQQIYGTLDRFAQDMGRTWP